MSSANETDALGKPRLSECRATAVDCASLDNPQPAGIASASASSASLAAESDSFACREEENDAGKLPVACLMPCVWVRFGQ